MTLKSGSFLLLFILQQLSTTNAGPTKLITSDGSIWMKVGSTSDTSNNNLASMGLGPSYTFNGNSGAGAGAGPSYTFSGNSGGGPFGSSSAPPVPGMLGNIGGPFNDFMSPSMQMPMDRGSMPSASGEYLFFLQQSPSSSPNRFASQLSSYPNLRSTSSLNMPMLVGNSPLLSAIIIGLPVMNNNDQDDDLGPSGFPGPNMQVFSDTPTFNPSAPIPININNGWNQNAARPAGIAGSPQANNMMAPQPQGNINPGPQAPGPSGSMSMNPSMSLPSQLQPQPQANLPNSAWNTPLPMNMNKQGGPQQQPQPAQAPATASQQGPATAPGGPHLNGPSTSSQAWS